MLRGVLRQERLGMLRGEGFWGSAGGGAGSLRRKSHSRDSVLVSGGNKKAPGARVAAWLFARSSCPAASFTSGSGLWICGVAPFGSASGAASLYRREGTNPKSLTGCPVGEKSHSWPSPFLFKGLTWCPGSFFTGSLLTLCERCCAILCSTTVL